MTVEFPSDLIHQLQISLRKEAGIFNYNPDDPRDENDQPPSLHEAIERLDPSCPPYLQCDQCHGRLLRGILSIVCIYCGKQRAQSPPDPILFNSTFGYRWLLQSLHLTGSEAVEASDSNKGSASKDAMILSDLLNIELKFPAESGENGANVPDKTQDSMQSPLNLAGVDLDNFFSEPKKESFPSGFEQHLVPDNPAKTTEMPASPGQTGFSLFENTQPMQTFMPTEHAVDDFSGWDAEFQSAGVGTVPVDSKALHLFPDASPIVPSSPLEKASESEAGVKFQYVEVDNNVNQKNVLTPQASISASLIENDQWRALSRESSTSILQLEMKSKADEDKHPKDNLNNLYSANNNLFQDDLWLTSSEKHTKDEESLDAWHDFSSSRNASDPFPSPSDPTNPAKTSTDKVALEKNAVSSSNGFLEEFDSFMAPNLFPGTSLHNASTSVNSAQESSYPDRLVETSSVDPKATESANGNVDAAAVQDFADNTAETIMSQMHDLSFMLEGNLSVPEKKNGDDLKSQI